MAERARRFRRYVAGSALGIGPATVLAVERIDVEARYGALGMWCTANKGIHALVLRDALGVRAVDLDGRPMRLDELRACVPGLDAALGAL